MERVRNIVVRIGLVLALVFCTGIDAQHEIRAQWAVTDAPQIAGNLVNTWSELYKMMEQIDVMTDQLDWLDDIMDVANRVNTVLQDVRVFERMFMQLERQASLMKNYASLLIEMENVGYSVRYIDSFRKQLQDSYRTVELLIQQGVQILADSGISKADKLLLAEKFADKVESQSNAMADELNDDIGTMILLRSQNQFQNLLSGRLPDANIETLGLNILDDPSYDEHEFEVGEVLEEEEHGFVSAMGKTGFTIILMLLGIMIAFSLVFIFVRFSRGDYNSEGAFARVFVVIVVAIVVTTVLHGVLGI